MSAPRPTFVITLRPHAGVDGLRAVLEAAQAATGCSAADTETLERLAEQELWP